jgi:hypothetical protein
MSKQKWIFVRTISSRKEFGTVWRVKRRNGHNGKLQIGYFKFTNVENEEYIGPLVANELISYRLAKLLNLKVANVELTYIGGRFGIISIKKRKRVCEWEFLNTNVHQDPFTYLVKPGQLFKTFIFDTWICNVDRHSGNLIVYPVGGKYNFYLIDHGLSLGGAIQSRRVPWDDPYWDDISRYRPRFVRGLLDCIYNYEQLRPYIEEIEALPPYVIEEAVNSVPSKILSVKQKQIFKNFLFHRQWNLRYMVRRWLDRG